MFRKKPLSVLPVLLAVIALIIGIQVKPLQKTGAPLPSPSPRARLSVTFIDVGQADSILVRTPTGHAMLIDAGNREDFEVVERYLTASVPSDSAGRPKLDMVIGTHPHEDHIGSMAQIVASSAIGRLYLPKAAANTRTFEDLLLAVKAANLKVTPAKAGIAFALDADTRVEFLAPNSAHYEELNNYSVVAKVTYKKVSFLLTGDAESLSEEEMLERGYDLQADVLKIGHHGSSSSTGARFLSQVAPKAAVISVGKGNSYRHPSRTTLKRLKDQGTRVYRTDRNGTIRIETDGTRLFYQVEKGASGGS
jgi:beta-lactamase superfamily II metal-dependent hydrolase